MLCTVQIQKHAHRRKRTRTPAQVSTDSWRTLGLNPLHTSHTHTRTHKHASTRTHALSRAFLSLVSILAEVSECVEDVVEVFAVAKKVVEKSGEERWDRGRKEQEKREWEGSVR